MGLITKNVVVKWTPYVKNHYESKGYTFTKLWDTFIANVEDLPSKSCEMVKVKCDYCGTEKEIRYSTFISNYFLNVEGKYACLKCSGIKRNTLSYEFIKNMVENLEKGYKLISKSYKRNNQKLKIQCNKGHIYETTYNSIKQGCKCPICIKVDGWEGKNNPRYNSELTNEERIHNRDTLRNVTWRKEVYKRDDYTCQCCGKRGYKLNAHHLNGYRWCKSERFDIDNGITLCEKCHKLFHKEYGYGNNTKEQFNEWILSKSATA